MLGDFYKEKINDQIWWVDELTEVNGTYEVVRGRYLFSFDKNGELIQ